MIGACDEKGRENGYGIGEGMENEVESALASVSARSTVKVISAGERR